MTVTPEILEADFKIAAIGTLIAGQWFATNANTSRVDQGEYPLLLVTGGVLHQVRSELCTQALGRLSFIATIPVICFTFNSQVCISKHCYQFLLRSAQKIQCTSGAAANSATNRTKRGRGVSDEVRSGSDCGRDLHALFSRQNECTRGLVEIRADFLSLHFAPLGENNDL
jgi:hypothetical protein